MSGDQSLNNRPMARIIDPLVEMGARIESHDGKPPLTVGFARRDHEKLHGIRYAMPIASAQVKSAVLLAGMYADGITRVKEPRPTRDHTERMLNGFGYPVKSDGGWISLEGGGKLVATDITVPADLSSATFFLLAAVISGDAGLLLRGVGVNPSRNGVLPLLNRMEANISLENQCDVGGEPVADLKVASSGLRAIDIGAADVALAVDEIPAIAVAAACAEGVTRISGAEELRVKESDRIATTVAGLKALGVEVEEHADGMTIQGGPIQGGVVDSHGDHRIAMAFAMAGNIARDPVRIRNVDCVATSFPGFDTLARSMGMSIELIATGETNG
jgi:3-phosphoshikimate 1-carboxyvinyltransferase